MRSPFRPPMHHMHFGRPPFPRHFHRPFFFGGGRLLGLVGLAALGYTLMDKRRREQQRTYDNGYVDVDSQDYS